MGIEIQNVMAVVMMDLVQHGRGHYLSESHATTVRSTWNQAKSVEITPLGRKKQSVQRMARPTACSHRNHFQTVCMSKDKAQSRNTSCLDENEFYDDKSSDEDEKHNFSIVEK